MELKNIYNFTELQEIEKYIKNNSDYPLGAIAATANNMAMMSTSCNVIHEYNITIQFIIENWEG